MHDVIHTWAAQYCVNPMAIADLFQRLGVGHDMPQGSYAEGMSESAVQERVRLAAAQSGIVAWRNNVGAMTALDGRVVRFGLCNDTKQLNDRLKSSDLVGIKPVTVTPDLLGVTIGQAWFREVKEGGWRYTGTERERAQAAFGALVMSKGGDFAFTTGGI